jgi:cytochrome P450
VSRASRNERRLLLAAHPVAYPLLRLVARAGPAVPVPGVGVVVNDAALAREVLVDPDRFRKDGPGSSGALWTPVLGPSVLLNMEGDAHRALRRKLAGLFTPAATERLCAGALAPLLARVRERLAAGEPVDLVDVTRVAAGAVVCELLGIRPPAGQAEERHRAMFEAGERVVAMVGLTTRRLSAAQVAEARAVLLAVTADAAAAWEAGDQATVPGRMRASG